MIYDSKSYFSFCAAKLFGKNFFQKKPMGSFAMVKLIGQKPFKVVQINYSENFFFQNKPKGRFCRTYFFLFGYSFSFRARACVRCSLESGVSGNEKARQGLAT
jgi:hypothetical protein